MIRLLLRFSSRVREASLLVIISSALLLTLLTAHAEPSILRIEMREHVEVQSDYLTLGDIAVVSSMDLELLRRALSVPLGRGPRFGTTTVLDSARLEYWLRSRLGVSSAQMVWSGPDSTLLSAAAQVLSGERLVATAHRGLAEHLSRVSAENGFSYSRIELQPGDEPRGVLIPAGSIDVIVRPLGNVRPSKRMLVWVDVFSNGLPVKAIPIRFDVAFFARALVAETAMAAGAVVGADNLEWREVDVAGLTFSALWRTRGERVRLRQSVAAGELITDKHVASIPAVSRGETARLASQNGFVSLESKVEVLQDGRLGDLVRARPVNATGVVTARVVAPGYLELQQ